MKLNNIEIAVLVKDRAITEYSHRGRTFVEGRAGSQYEIEVRNSNPFRVEVILSVDGLSVTDGKTAGPQSTGYLVEAGGTIRVPGWSLDRAQAASFTFSGPEAASKGNRVSYAEQMTGSSHNNGVIGALAYAEQQRPAVIHAMPLMWNGQPHAHGGATASVSSNVGMLAGSASHAGWSWRPEMIAASSSTTHPLGLPNGDRSISGSAVTFVEMSCSSATASASMANQLQNAVSRSADTVVEPALGTAFGEATGFCTTAVSFERADLHAVLEVYYDSARGLKARGIEIVRPSKQRYEGTPQAFPGLSVGCTPPPGYRG